MDGDMNINKIFSSDIFSMSSSKTKTTSEKSSSTAPVATQSSPDSIWHRLASKYDVRSITSEEMDKLSLELYNAGEISLLDRGTLFMPKLAETLGDNISLTQADSSGRRDMIAEFEARIDMDKSSIGNILRLPIDSRILQHLERLDAAKSGPVHITA